MFAAHSSHHHVQVFRDLLAELSYHYNFDFLINYARWFRVRVNPYRRHLATQNVRLAIKDSIVPSELFFFSHLINQSE